MNKKSNLLITIVLLCSVATTFSISQDVRELVDSLYEVYECEPAFYSQLPAIVQNKEQCLKLIKLRIQVNDRKLNALKRDLSSREWKLLASVIVNGLCCWLAAFFTTDSIPVLGNILGFIVWPLNLKCASNILWRNLDVYTAFKQKRKITFLLARDKEILAKIEHIKPNVKK